MKKKRILREYFLGFQNLLCNCEVNLAERLSELCVLGVTNNTQVYLGDPIPTILMKVQENETLKDAIGRFKTMYPKN